MDRVLFLLNGTAISMSDVLLGGGALAFLCLVFLAFTGGRGIGARGRDGLPAERLERAIITVARQNAELAGRMHAMAEALGSRQTDLARFVAERLDAASLRIGNGLENSSRAAGSELAKLNERLAVIDAAQARIASLAEDVVGLKDILGNKQARGAFGQVRLETIIADSLPPSAFAFQHKLSNNTRPDCVIRLPGDPRLMVIDAKFPLEAFTALKDAAGEAARRSAAARVRADVSKHLRDIAERYFVPGVTQDIAILFVPAESVYADLHHHFDDLIQRAHRSRIVIVSPSLLVMAVQVMQTMVRDARLREEAGIIQEEVRRLAADVARLRLHAARLDQHFTAAQEDVDAIVATAEKVARTGARIDRLDLPPGGDGPGSPLAQSGGRGDEASIRPREAERRSGPVGADRE